MPFARAYSRPAALSATQPISRAARKPPSDFCICLILTGCEKKGTDSLFRRREQPKCKHFEWRKRCLSPIFRILLASIFCLAARAEEPPAGLAKLIAARE